MLSDADIVLLMTWAGPTRWPPTPSILKRVEALELPPQYRKVRGPVYRGLGLNGFNPEDFDPVTDLGGKRARGAESWTKDFDIAWNFATVTSKGRWRVVLKYTPTKDEVIADVDSIFLDKEIMERARKLNPGLFKKTNQWCEDEVILRKPNYKRGENRIFFKVVNW